MAQSHPSLVRRRLSAWQSLSQVGWWQPHRTHVFAACAGCTMALSIGHHVFLSVPTQRPELLRRPRAALWELVGARIPALVVRPADGLHRMDPACRRRPLAKKDARRINVVGLLPQQKLSALLLLPARDKRQVFLPTDLVHHQVLAEQDLRRDAQM